MRNRKPIFITSDWHLGHANVLHLSKRSFKDLDHMHRVLINNYNAAVPEDGICYFLGDMGLCNGNIIFDIINQLNGTKILLMGNHDKGFNKMYSLGFDMVMNSGSLMIANELVTMSHYPLLGVYRENTEGMRGAREDDNWHKEYKHASKAIHDNGQFHLHGHIHSPNSGKSQKILGRQYDVGVDANNYRPVSISQIESFIAKEKVYNTLTLGYDLK